MSAEAIAYNDELARARAIAAERRRVLAEAPELSAEEILEGFKRELRSVAVPGFGTVYYYHPMSVAEQFEVHSKIEGDEMTAANLVQAIIVLARNRDGGLKFKPEHAAALLEAPQQAVMKLASTVISSFKFSVASAEKK